MKKLVWVVSLPFLVWACGDGPTDPSGTLRPGQALQASGGGKGPPGNGGGGGKKKDPGDITIDEFFVYEAGGLSHVHVVLSEVPDILGSGGVLDHVGDGIQGYDPLEPFGAGAGTMASETEAGIQMLEDGRAHVDLPMDPEEFLNSPYFDLDGQGGDPWAFYVVWDYLDGDNVTHAPRTPDGIVLDGVTHGIEESDVTGAGHSDPFGTVRSWASIGGQAAANGSTWVESIDVANASCYRTTVGKGRNRRAATVVEIQADVSFGNGMSSDFWYSIGLAVADSDAFVDRYEGSVSTPTLQATVEGSPSSVDVRLLVDHVFPYFEYSGLVYDPLNAAAPLSGSTMTAGDLTVPFTTISTVEPGQHPVVVRGVSVSCPS